MYKRKKDQDPRSKRLRTEGQFTSSELGQMQSLVFGIVHKREPEIAESLDGTGMIFDGVVPSDFEFYLTGGEPVNFGAPYSEDSGFGSSEEDEVVPQTPSQEIVYESDPESYSLPEKLFPPVRSERLPLPQEKESVSEDDEEPLTQEQQEQEKQELLVQEMRELRASALEGFEVDLDEDYINQVAGEVAGEAFRAFFDEVLSELADEIPDPEILRWLIRGDAEMTKLLDAARAETVSKVKVAIRELAPEPGMAQK